MFSTKQPVETDEQTQEKSKPRRHFQSFASSLMISKLPEQILNHLFKENGITQSDLNVRNNWFKQRTQFYLSRRYKKMISYLYFLIMFCLQIM